MLTLQTGVDMASAGSHIFIVYSNLSRGKLTTYSLLLTTYYLLFKKIIFH